MRRFMRKVAALAVVCLAVAGCAREQQDTLSIATNQWPGYEPLYLARDLGYLEGADIRLVELPSNSKSISAFRNGAVDALAVTLDEALLLVQDQIAARVVLVMDVSHGADVVMARPDITSLAALKGRRIGVESFALGAYMLSRALEAGGLRPEDVVIVPLTVDQHEMAYKSGQVDAVITFDPVRTKLLATGATILFDSSRIPNEIFDVLVVRQDYLNRHPQQLERLKAAWFKALDYLRANPENASARMARRQGISGEEFRLSLKGLHIPDRGENAAFLEGAQPGLIAPAQRLGQVMERNRLLRHEVDPRLLLGRP